VDLSTDTEDQPRCSILNRLESVEQLTRQTGQCRTSVVLAVFGFSVTIIIVF